MDGGSTDALAGRSSSTVNLGDKRADRPSSARPSGSLMLRSQKLLGQALTDLGEERKAQLETMISAELGLPCVPLMATERICTAYESLRAQILQLLDKS